MTDTTTLTENIGSTPSIDEVCERQAIHDVLCAHSRGLDRGETKLLKSAYWPEAEVDYGGFKGNAHQFAERIGAVLESMYELTQHSLGQSFVRIDRESAKSETYVKARHLLIGGQEHMIFFGRYLDQYQCRNGCWKIIHRQVVMDWGYRTAIVEERNTDAFTALAKGDKRQQDPAYIFFK